MKELQEFLRKDWDLTFRAELYKQEFYATDAWALSVRDPMVGRWDDNITTAELKHLRALKEQERPAHVGEIIREQRADVMIGLWYDRLEIGPTSHPLTTELLHATIYLAGSVATCLKDRFNRVRPSVLAPDLSPPIPVPELPAYPGGHATQIYLMAATLTHLFGNREPKIKEIADNVALNRERAGLNYPSDTAAGRELSGRVFAILESQCEMFKAMLKKGSFETAMLEQASVR
jgi:acid phosphatase (class A)